MTVYESALEAPPARDSPLYQAILGTAWLDVAAPILRAHCNGAPVAGRGSFRVFRGRRRLSRLLALFLRLPRATNSAVTKLEIIPEAAVERWERTFNGRRFTSRQYVTGEGMLAERFGALEIWFALEVREDVLIYHQQGAALYLGRRRIVLPPWLAPQVSGREKAVGGKTHVQVQIDLSVGGLLIAYDGLMDIDQQAP
jgi:hypothetical protein